ncbi:MAG: hypothetical protein PVH98_11610, partial [Gammaproteobacteria bacterium]
MKIKSLTTAVYCLFAIMSNYSQMLMADATVEQPTLTYPKETHFQNLRRLTFGGQNAEAYFSFDG